jgi:hypothetical protein
MTQTISPQRQERRDIRYPLHLPVSVKVAHREMHARSENISLRGILVSSAFLIPKGSTVEVAVGVAHLPDPGIQIDARGKVLRVQPTSSGRFSVAIAFERPFRFGRPSLGYGSQWNARSLQENGEAVTNRGRYFAPAWHTET